MSYVSSSNSNWHLSIQMIKSFFLWNCSQNSIWIDALNRDRPFNSIHKHLQFDECQLLLFCLIFSSCTLMLRYKTKRCAYEQMVVSEHICFLQYLCALPLFHPALWFSRPPHRFLHYSHPGFWSHRLKPPSFTVVWLCSYKDRCVCRTPKRLIEVLFRWSTIWIDRLLLCNIYSAFASFFLLTNPSVTKLFAAFVTYTPSVRYTLSSPFLRVYRLQPLTKFFLAAKKLSTVKSNRSSISCFTNTWYALYLILSLCFFSNSFPLSRKRLVKKVSMVPFLEKSFVVMIVVYVLLEEISHGSIVLPPPRFNLVR